MQDISNELIDPLQCSLIFTNVQEDTEEVWGLGLQAYIIFL